MALVTVLANGGPLAGWLEVHVEQAFDKCSGQAQVTMSEQPGRPLPMKLGDKAAVLIDGRPVITGHVHEVNGRLDERSHTITVTIRDQTQDFIDSTVGPNLKLKSPITPQQLAQRTIGAMGLKIPVRSEAPGEPYQQGERISAAIDERGFNFVDKWLQKRQLLMNTDGKGSLVVTRNMGKRGGGMLYSAFEDSPRNNVLKSTYRNSDLNRHNSMAVNAQKSTTDKEWWESKEKGEKTAQADKVQKNWGVGNDTSVRPDRKIHARGTQGLAGTSPRKAAQWRTNEAKARGFQYTATVQGFYGGPPGASGGFLWWPGFIIPVFDAHWELSTELLISEVRFSKTWGGGETTEVTCTWPDAYTTDAGGGAAAAGRTASLGMGSVAPGSFAAGDGGVST